MLNVEPHPLADLAVFTSSFPHSLSQESSPDWLKALLRLDAEAPMKSDEATRGAVRDLLRHGGYKPTGRGKPASEYLIRAAGEGSLSSINAAVDICNAVSLHSGLPISVVDRDRVQPPLRVAVAPKEAKYVFNASGQEIDLEGLLCLFDAEGPCANAVKDSQRTKTHPASQRILTVVWGTRAVPGRTAAAANWFRQLVERLGGSSEANLAA